MPIEKDDYYPEDNIDIVDYGDFQLVSPLGGLFRYYREGGMYYREALNAHAEWTQPDGVKKLSKTVYDLAHRTAVKADA